MQNLSYGVPQPDSQAAAANTAYCANCEHFFHEAPDVTPDSLQFFVDEDGRFKGCPQCRTDAFLLYADELTWL